MGLLDNVTQIDYYQGDDHGNYQFTSLDDIITQFMIGYVGEDKTISKVKRTDVSFYAQRALQELSFDTFKSTKAQEIVVPTTLQMILPHDYVNYTKISWSDSSGIKHRLYPTTCKTSNPFKILQDSDNNYDFSTTAVTGNVLVPNSNFNENNFLGSANGGANWGWTGAVSGDTAGIDNNQLKFETVAFTYTSTGGASEVTGRTYAVWHPIDTTYIDLLNVTADGGSSEADSGYSDATILRVGISSTKGDDRTNPSSLAGVNQSTNHLVPPDPNIIPYSGVPLDDKGPNFLPTKDNLPGWMEWEGTGTTLTELKLLQVDVSAFDEVYLLITHYTPFTGFGGDSGISLVDNIVVESEGTPVNLTRDGDSTTWTNYRSTTPSENNNDDYQDDTYWLAGGERYGLDPQHAQANGSFFIDQQSGKIYFSSNISGKTVVLDYISDSLGTDNEMQVHKFAEEAIYKWIAYGILSTRANTPEYIINRYKKEKFAETRKAKLRLSNIKLEEITQVLRGKSKQIKH